MEKTLYDESSSATESDDDSNDEDSASEGMVIDEQDSETTPQPSSPTPPSSQPAPTIEPEKRKPQSPAPSMKSHQSNPSTLKKKKAIPSPLMKKQKTTPSPIAKKQKATPSSTLKMPKSAPSPIAKKRKATPSPTLKKQKTTSSPTLKNQKEFVMPSNKPKIKTTPIPKVVSPKIQSSRKVKSSKTAKPTQSTSTPEDKSKHSIKSPVSKDWKKSPKIKSNNNTSSSSSSPKSKPPTVPLSPPPVAQPPPPPPTSLSPSSRVGGGAKKNARSLMLTGRGVTTQMLIEQQILEPGENCLCINYLGRKFMGDLILDGTIKCHSADKVFSSPSAWAMHCKKQVNPDKKSGCGWASVRYKGRKLDEFKSTWFRKQKIEQQVAASSENDSLTSSAQFSMNMSASDLGNSPISKHKHLISDVLPANSSGYVPPTENYVTFSEALKAVQNRQSTTTSFSRIKSEPSVHSVPHHSSMYADSQHKVRKRAAPRTRISVKHSLIQANSDPTTLIECAQFTSTGKIQPFSITISTSALLLIDFHCHLTMSEVFGYLAGKWDANRQHIRVTQAFPCRYMSTTDDMEIDNVETEIRNTIERSGLMLLGWYHSHPLCQPDPSLRDIRAQSEYQKALKDGHYEPCVGMIVSPYDSYRKESQFNAFWVREPFDGKSSSVGLPLLMKFTTHQDQTLTQELVDEMVALVNYYQGSTECVKFSENWSADSSYLDKIKHSVIRKFPQDQTGGRFLDFIHKMLMAVCG